MTTVARSAVATPIATIFTTNEGLITLALGGLTSEQLWQAPTARNNPMLWIAGHLVHSRAELLAVLGAPFDTGWGQTFTRGATVGEPAQYPSRDEVERAMTEVSRRLHATLAALDDDQLAQPPAIPAPGANTLADLIALFAFHDSYHVGQMGFVRKALGFPQLAG